MYQDLPAREKSQRIINRQKRQEEYHDDEEYPTMSKPSQKKKTYHQYKSKPKQVNHLHDLLPGLNDISDAFEALPLDLIKYFTLLKEIDAKCINTIPQINQRIKTYINNLHKTEEEDEDSNLNNLSVIKNKINEVIPCLEEKMHVTSVASDLLSKHMYRINQDYKLIIMNNEIPESIRIGPLNHPAMINKDSNSSNTSTTTATSQNNNNNYNNGNSAQSQRSETRREALAARKAGKSGFNSGDDEKDYNGKDSPNQSNAGRKKKLKESTPMENRSNQNTTNNNNNSYSNNQSSTQNNGNSQFKDKKRGRNDNDRNSNNMLSKKKKMSKEYDEDNDEINESDSSRRDGKQRNNSNSGVAEPTYCYCNQVSFGEMVGCDGDDCKREWFHLPCIGFKNPPKGKWYCDDCLIKMKKSKKI